MSTPGMPPASPLQDVRAKMTELHGWLVAFQTKQANRDQEVHRRTVQLIESAEASRALEQRVSAQLLELHQQGDASARVLEDQLRRLRALVLWFALGNAALVVFLAVLVLVVS